MLVRRLIAVLIAGTSIACPWTQAQRITTTAEIVIGHHSFFDFGPPMNFYEVYILRAAGASTKVEHLFLTPPAGMCNEQTTLELQTAEIGKPLEALLLNKDPCSITDKQISREAHRKRDRLQFSGANLVMRVSCSGEERLLPVQLLEEDLFSSRPKPPTETSWSMQVMEQLDSAVGKSVMDRPAFAPETTANGVRHPPSAAITSLAAGRYDDLFSGPPHVLSRLYAETLQPAQVSSIRILSSSITPVRSAIPNYPPIGRAAHVGGNLHMHAMISPEGKLVDIARVSGPEMLAANTLNTLKAMWLFSQADAGKSVEVEFGFDLNCNTSRRDSDLPR